MGDEEELSSSLIDSKMGQSSGISVECWQVGPEILCMRGIEMWVKIGNVPCEREVLVEGVTTR
jgi:hypothetical protein